MSINFYYMTGCYYCDKAKEMLSKELASGEINLKSSNDAPSGVKGFPYFENPQTGASQSGLPQTKDQLYEKLGVETYQHMSAPSLSCDEAELYLQQSQPDKYQTAIWWCHPTSKSNSVSSPNNKLIIVGKIIFINSDLIPVKVSDLVKVDQKAGKLTDIKNKVTLKDFIASDLPKLVKIFPCTKPSDWDDYDSILKLFSDDKTIEQVINELIPQPCENDKSVYCCNGEKGPKFLDMKTIVMLSVIGLLFFGVLFLLMSKN